MYEGLWVCPPGVRKNKDNITKNGKKLYFGRGEKGGRRYGWGGRWTRKKEGRRVEKRAKMGSEADEVRPFHRLHIHMHA